MAVMNNAIIFFQNILWLRKRVQKARCLLVVILGSLLYLLVVIKAASVKVTRGLIVVDKPHGRECLVGLSFLIGILQVLVYIVWAIIMP